MKDTPHAASSGGLLPGAGNPQDVCGAPKKDGASCGLKPVLGLTHCFVHAEELTEERTLARRRGGLNATAQRFLDAGTASPVSLSNAADARRLLEETIQQARTGQLAPNVANSIGYLVSVGLRIAELELSSQVAALEAALAAQDRERRR